MTSPDPEAGRRAPSPYIPAPVDIRGAEGYRAFYEQVAAAQVAAWATTAPGRVLDLSGGGPHWAKQLAGAGHDVLRVDPTAACGAGKGGAGTTRVAVVCADRNELSWLADSSVDAVLAEGRALSLCLATERTCHELFRVLRPGGRLLLVVDSLLTGLSRLADQGRWAELADIPAADCVLVTQEDGSITRCFWPEELTALLVDSGLDVQWVRARTVLTPAAVERALAHGHASAMAVLVRTELDLSAEREGESSGMHLVASATRPAAKS